MSFQIFAISGRSKFWKQIAGKSLKANRWKIFESKSLENFWKLIAGKFLKAFWKQITGKFLKAFWKQIAGKFLKANRWKIFESKSLENFWKLFESKSLENFWKLFESSAILFLQWLRYASDKFLCICTRKSWDLLMKASHKEKYIDPGQKTIVILPTRYLCAC